MHAGDYYKFKEFFLWTRTSIYWLIPHAVIPTVLYAVVGWTWLAVPWVPVALIGTASAFIVGFKNTQTYNRAWEARQIWGSIVNSSRTWGIMVKDFIRTSDLSNENNDIKVLFYRHIAWLTALRFQLRESRVWENVKTKSYNKEYLRLYCVEEWKTDLSNELKPFLSAEEHSYILTKKNRATQIISLQSAHLRKLADAKAMDTFQFVALENILKDFYEHQGRCERIKNFPYPRQFASINLFFIHLFVALVPFGMLNEFQRLGEHGIWLTIPFSMIVSWVFTSLEQVGEATENPFEGGPNDTPITALSRTIEIDLRDMLNETELPPPVKPVHDILT